MTAVKPKKAAAKKATKRALVCAEGSECFWTTDGKIISNLVELEQALATMADEVFSYHVNKEKNDFATWIESVLQDRELSAKIKSARKPKTARTVVLQRLKVYGF